MTDTENNAVLDIFSLERARGDSAILYQVVDDSYTFSGLPDMESIDKINFNMFWVNFMSNIVDGGGPEFDSCESIKFKNIIRRKVSRSSSIHLNYFFKKIMWEMG